MYRRKLVKTWNHQNYGFPLQKKGAQGIEIGIFASVGICQLMGSITKKMGGRPTKPAIQSKEI